ncbi:WXG100-like domain-containing protein, partial [Nocardia thailandica]
MSMELPSGLHWLSILAGMEWPEGDEDGMWGMAGDWHTAADGLRAIIDDIDAAKAAAHKAYPQGEGVEDMLKAFESLARGDGGDKDQSIQKLATLFDQVGDSVYQTGTEIEYTKLMFYSSLLLLAAEIAAAWIFPPTAPAVEAAAIGATRIAARVLTGRVIAAILRNVAKAAATRLVKFLARHVAIDTVLGTLQELGIQQWQKDQGHRKEIDWNQVKATAISSAAGGAAAGPFGHWLGNKLGNSMKPWLRNAITGVGAGLVGAGGGMLGQFGYDAATVGLDKAWNNLKTAASDPLMWSAGASNGALSGLNKGAATNAWQSMKPGLFERPNLSTRIAETLGPDANLGTFGQNSGANTGAGDGSTGRHGEGDGDGAGANQGDRSRTGAGEAGSGDGGGENRAGDAEGQKVRPAGSTDAPEAQGDTMAGDPESRTDHHDSGERQATGDGGGPAPTRQEARPEAAGGDTAAGDGSGGRHDSGPRAQAEAPAAQADSGATQHDAPRAGVAEDTPTGTVENTRTDAASGGEPVAQSRDTAKNGAAPLTTAAGAPPATAAGAPASGPAQTAGPAQSGAPAQAGGPTHTQGGAPPANSGQAPQNAAAPQNSAQAPSQGGAPARPRVAIKIKPHNTINRHENI